ncbi:hypothetical protein FH008_15095 [Listeria monocytogenes]|nr:hypothetical protein [Listeria monocytogenes]
MIVGKLNPKYNRKIKNNSKTVLETPINAKKEKMTKVAKQAIRVIIKVEKESFNAPPLSKKVRLKGDDFIIIARAFKLEGNWKDK